MNQTVLMSGTDYFTNDFAINSYMNNDDSVDQAKAAAEHQLIKQALEDAGITVLTVPPPAGCQDGVYTANWALCRNNKAVMARLPNKRQAEEACAAQSLDKLGLTIIIPPDGLRFSGQGDALPCGNYLLAGSHYRTDPDMHQFLADTLGYEVISLQAVPEFDANKQPVINSITGFPDSFFYDIDLALSVLRPDLIAWCPEAFLPESQDKLSALPITKIEVSLEEAMQGFACNLVSTGETVIMSGQAPQLQSAIEAYGLKTVTPQVTELVKGGGFIRCTSLTLDNN